ncbi:MAG: sulfotransferase domain-containing protein [Desulfobacteraceae bacterium]|jgi:hypothetical protein
METRCCVHIGLPKTGTKTLQWHLFSQHSQVAYLGLFSGKIRRGHRRFKKCRDASIRAIMGEIGWGDDIFHPNIAGCKELFKRSVGPDLEQGKVPIWSWESLALDVPEKRRARAENLRRVFGPCRVFIAIRHPVDLMKSAYFQILRRENMNWANRKNLFGRYSYFFTVEQWLEKCFLGEIAPHLDYARTTQIYADVFGKEAVSVFLFEDLKEEPSVFVKSVCELVGIDESEGVLLTREKRENVRWTSEQVERLRRIDQSIIKKWRFHFAPRRLRLRMIGIGSYFEPGTGPRFKVDIPKVWQDRIAERTREGNRWLAKEWKLPLEKYEYPL